MIPHSVKSACCNFVFAQILDICISELSDWKYSTVLCIKVKIRRSSTRGGSSFILTCKEFCFGMQNKTGSCILGILGHMILPAL